METHTLMGFQGSIRRLVLTAVLLLVATPAFAQIGAQADVSPNPAVGARFTVKYTWAWTNCQGGQTDRSIRFYKPGVSGGNLNFPQSCGPMHNDNTPPDYSSDQTCIYGPVPSMDQGGQIKIDMYVADQCGHQYTLPTQTYTVQ